MNDGEQNPGKSISSSKLSASVPEFVPRIAYTGKTPASDVVLVINSNLSPFVPEFRPSVSVTPSGSSHQTIHSLQDQTKQAYVKQEKTELQQKVHVPLQASQTTFSPSKKITAKTASSVISKKPDRTCEGQILSESNAGEFTAESAVKVTKKKRQRKKKESSELIQQQDNRDLNTKSSTRSQQESDSLKDVSPGKMNYSVKSKTNEACSSSQQNCSPLLSSTDKSSANTNVTVSDFRSSYSIDQQSNERPSLAPTLTVSYSDKVKSVFSKNNSSSNHSLEEKCFLKDFHPENSRTKDKHVDWKQGSEFLGGQNTRAANVNGNEKKPVKSGCRGTDDSSSKTAWEDSKYYKLRDGDSLKSQTTASKQTYRTGKAMAKSSRYKNMCDDDDNWRVKKDVDSSVSCKTEMIVESNTKNCNSESLKKRTFQQKEFHVDLNPTKHEDLELENTVGLTVVDKNSKGSKKQQNVCNFIDLSQTELAASSKFSISKARSDLPDSSQEHRLREVKNFSVHDTNSKIVEGEFPDLKESVKIKRLSSTEERTVDHKEVVMSPRTSAPMSYSTVLRTPPQLKLIQAWENEHPSPTRGGLLKVPPQATLSGAENEASQGDSNQKKKKKKKKKKQKTEETGEQTKGSGSTKRTQKPIQFDLGVMLETISKSSPDKPQQSGRKLVVATGVLPSQLSVVSPTDVKPGVKTPQLKEESKIPHNKLDSTAPVVKRGKERETPARKKPSSLKKIILKERQEKKKARETTENDDADETSDHDDNENITCESDIENVVLQEIQNQSSEDDTEDAKPLSPTDQEIAAEIHSRRFREYCFQVPDKEVDTVASDLLRELVRFQDRQFHKDPVKAKAKRRFVLGLREVNKHLKLRRLKCVIISSNVERIKSAGGLDDTLKSIITLCQENQVPVVFALKRQLLGKVLLKKVPVSIVGIFNYDGAQDHFKKLIELTQKTKQAYTDRWQETREKLELQQKDIDIKTTEMDKVPGAEVQQEAAIFPQASEGAGESSNDEDGDFDEESENDSEKEDIIVENDLELHDISSSIN